MVETKSEVEVAILFLGIAKKATRLFFRYLGLRNKQQTK